MPLHRRNSSGQAVEDTQYLEEITEAAEPEDTDRLHEITCSAPKVLIQCSVIHTLFTVQVAFDLPSVVNLNLMMV